MNKELVTFIFDYFKYNDEYLDKEDFFSTSKGLSDDDIKTQKAFEDFTFTVLKYCTKLKKYFYNDKDDFENYTLYLKYKEQKITVLVLYGLGSFFSVTKAKDDYRDDLEVNVEDVLLS